MLTPGISLLFPSLSQPVRTITEMNCNIPDFLKKIQTKKKLCSQSRIRRSVVEMKHHLLNDILKFLPCTVKLLKIQACQDQNKTSSSDITVAIYCWSGNCSPRDHACTHSYTHTHTHCGMGLFFTVMEHKENLKTKSPHRVGHDYTCWLEHVCRVDHMTNIWLQTSFWDQIRISVIVLSLHL